jgi:hypothetical protein
MRTREVLDAMLINPEKLGTASVVDE